MRHFLSISDVPQETLAKLVDWGMDIVAGKWDDFRPLSRKVVGIYFRGTSTRTRTSFTVGAIHLGATPVAFGPNDLQLSTGESVGDTGRVLAEYLDALVIRTNESVDEMRELAHQSTMAVINAMSDNEHPTQVVGDLITLKEALGRLHDLHVLYLGEGNNTAAALALSFAKTPRMRLTVVTPEGYGLPQELIDEANRVGAANGSVIEQHHDMARLPKGVDAVYTTRWETMGVSHAEENWRDRFLPYQVTEAVMAEASKPEGGTIFMHDLPAIRGSDVVDEVLDGPQSVAFRQARHKMTSAMAVLNYCVGVEPPA